MRGVLLPDDLRCGPVWVELDWTAEERIRLIGPGRITHCWTRYWPLVKGFWDIEGQESGGEKNLLASVFFELPLGEEVVYGPALLLGYDPVAKELCSVPDRVRTTSVESWNLLTREQGVNRGS